MRNKPIWSLLKTSRFLPLFCTQFLGAFNDNFFKNALAILMTYQLGLETKQTEVMVAIAGGLFLLPFFLFSGLAGQLADKYQKVLLIRWVKFFEVVIFGIGFVGFSEHSISFLLIALFLLGTHSTFFGPVKYAILPEFLNQRELVTGNAWIESSTFLSVLFGTIAGGYIVSAPSGSVLVPLLGMTIAALGLATSFFIPFVKTAIEKTPLSFNLWSQTWDILLYAKEHRSLFYTILGISWFWLVGAVFVTLFPMYAKYTLGVQASVVTVFLALFSVGIAVGSMMYARFQGEAVHYNYLPFGIFAMSLFIFDLYLASPETSYSTQLLSMNDFLFEKNSWRILIDVFLVAFCGGTYIVPLYTALQTVPPLTHRSRTIAANNFINSLFIVLAALVTAGLLFLAVSIPHLFLLLAIFNFMATIQAGRLLPDAVLKSFIAVLLRIFYRVRVEGIDNYYDAGERILIIANHVSLLDGLLLAAFLPHKALFPVNTFTAQAWWIRPLLWFVDAFPIDSTNPLSIKILIQKVKENKRCIIFPEGRITVTSGLMKVYEGPGLIADKAQAMLLPIRIEGPQYSPFSRLKNKVKIRWFPKITINILPPRKIDVASDVKGRRRRQIINLQLTNIMEETLVFSSNQHKLLFNHLVSSMSVYGAGLPIIEDFLRKPISYRQFFVRIFLLAKLLKQKTDLGEAVGLLLPNAIGTSVTLFALYAIARIPAMLNYTAGDKGLLVSCQTAKIRCVLTSRIFMEQAKLIDAVNLLRAKGIVVIYLEDLRDKVDKKEKISALIKAFFPRFFYWLLRKTQTSSSTALILFTSGSEGTPKAVLLSHENILANAYQLKARISCNSQDMVFNALPLFHSFGLMGGIFLPLFSGVKTFLYPSPLHYRTVPELVYDSNATILFGTDTFLSGYARRAHSYDFYNLKYVFAGAERLKPETQQLWQEKFGVRLLEGYGITETAPALAINSLQCYKTGTSGRFLPGIHYRLEPVEGLLEGGRLFVSGPNIMMGYYLSDAPGILQPPPQGWYDTGDIVKIDEEGYVTILGRIKRFAKIAGEMVSLLAVEKAITDCWNSTKHAVLAVADFRKGEHLVLVTTEKNARREILRDFFHHLGLSELWLPKKIMEVNDLPLLGSGKTDYVALEKQVKEF